MTNAWDDMKRTKEEEFFQRQNREILARLKTRKSGAERLCPVDKEKLQLLEKFGITVDVCPKCLGAWFDAGELNHILDAARKEAQAKQGDWVTNFFESIFGKK